VNATGPPGLPSTLTITEGAPATVFAAGTSPFYGANLFNDVDFADVPGGTIPPVNPLEFLALSITGNSDPTTVTATINSNGDVSIVSNGQNPAPGNSTTITVRATDAGGAFVEKQIVVTVTPVNNAPTVTHNDQIPNDTGTNNANTTVDGGNDDV